MSAGLGYFGVLVFLQWQGFSSVLPGSSDAPWGKHFSQAFVMWWLFPPLSHITISLSLHLANKHHYLPSISWQGRWELLLSHKGRGKRGSDNSGSLSFPSMEPFLPNADIPHSYWAITPSISSFVFISNRNWNTKCISLSFLLNLSLQPHLIGEKPWHIYLTNCYLSSSSLSFSFYLLVGWEVQNFHFLFSLERTSSLTYIFILARETKFY